MLFIVIFIFGIALWENGSINIGLRSQIMNEYFLNGCFLYRMLLTFIAIFLFANSIFPHNDFYGYFILTNMKRKRYIITKIIANMFVIVGLSVFIYILYLFIGFIKIKGFYWQLSTFLTFITLTIIALIYGLYAFLLMQGLNNQFVIIITFGLVIISNNLDYKSYLLLVLPNDNHYGIFHLFWLLIVLIIINVKIYLDKDLNY